MRFIIDLLIVAIYSDTVFRRRVQSYVLTRPGTHAAGLAFAYVKSHPCMHAHATREHVETAAHLAHLRLNSARAARLQRAGAAGDGS